MNNTKWQEIRLAMYELGKLSPRWRTRDLKSGYVSDWDGEWFYHLRAGGFETIEWLEIATPDDHQRAVVLKALQRIHVPGEEIPTGFRVYGYAEPGRAVEYL